MENSIIVPQSVKVFIKMGKKKGNKANELVGILKEYREKYTSVELQKEAMKWWMQISDRYKYFLRSFLRTK